MLCLGLLKHKTWKQMEIWTHSSVRFKLGTEWRRVIGSRYQLLQPRKKESGVSFGYEAGWTVGNKNPFLFPWIQPRLFFVQHVSLLLPCLRLLKNATQNFMWKQSGFLYFASNLYSLLCSYLFFRCFFQQLLFIPFQLSTLPLVLMTYLKITQNENNNYPFWYSENGR